MTLEQEIKNWQRTTDLFKRMGLDENSVVADFGSGKGRYSIAASYSVKKVYALDVSKYALQELKQEAKGITNIEPVHVGNKGILPLEDNSIDCIMIYDLIHQIDSIKDTFIQESHRVLKSQGILSVLPFHLSTREIKALQRDIESYGFTLDNSLVNEGYHFEMHEWLHGNRGHLDDIERRTIYNFRKNK